MLAILFELFEVPIALFLTQSVYLSETNVSDILVVRRQ